jgi:hypothetical protein
VATANALRAAQRVSLPAATPLVAAGLTALFVWGYWPVIPGLAAQWWNEPEYSHGFLIPMVSAYLIWNRRNALRSAPVSPGILGLGLMALAGVVYLTGSVGADLFLQRLSLVLMLAGGVLYVTGPTVFRMLLFPLALLLLMIPLPGIIFNAIPFHFSCWRRRPRAPCSRGSRFRSSGKGT